MMQLLTNSTKEACNTVCMHAHNHCKEFDPKSDCYAFLTEKMEDSNSKFRYLVADNGDVVGLAILEHLDSDYGNLIVHTIDEAHESYFASLLMEDRFLGSYVLEHIQFRSNFNYRDIFLQFGCKEKERVRMIHEQISDFADLPTFDGVSFKPLTESDEDAEACGIISYEAHKHRLHVERYDAYASPEKRAKFCKELRTPQHGKPISNACVLMYEHDVPIGVMETVLVHNWGMDMGWLMDVALLPTYQGLGYGKHMVHYVLHTLHNLGYTHCGLGVTCSNNNAHDLYERMGFKDYEFFVEVIANG